MSTETKHTPGPWMAGTSGFSIGGLSFLPVQVGTLGSAKVSEADLKLIAAAPELLEALKYARRFVKAEDVDTAFIDAAIIKAEGNA